jgi:hypothetical protein
MTPLFLRIMAEAMEELGPTPSQRAVADWMRRATELFIALEDRGRKALRGLWAELVVILSSDDPSTLIRRWHADPQERFDFLGDWFALEVKSCQDFDRVHQFSLPQLRPADALGVWVGSLVVREDPAGRSTLELLEQIEASITDQELRATARRIVFASAGAALEEDDQHRFDEGLARSSLLLADARLIPSITGQLPPEVLDVKLSVRCRDVPPAGAVADAVARLR